MGFALVLVIAFAMLAAERLVALWRTRGPRHVPQQHTLR
jgi:hypothetical protein